MTYGSGPRRSPADRRALARELARVVGEGGVLWRDAELLTYDADGIVLEKRWPDLVVLPRDTDEVRRVVRLAAREALPIVARGAGTGLAGGCVAERGGIVLSVARMDRILAVDRDDRVAVVQPGVVNLELTRAVEPLGLRYAPDPSSQMSSTVGGNVAANAGGPHCLKYGQTHRHVLGAVFVTAEGDVVRAGGPAADGPAGELIALLVGSEGTLGVLTEITVRLVREPEAVRTFLAVFDSVEAASQAVSDVIAAGMLPAALEMIDRLIIQAVEPFVRVGLPLDAEAALLVELDGPRAGMDRRAREIRALCAAAGAREFREARDDAERALLWKARKGAFGAMGRITPGFHIMDGVVPRSRLPEALRRVGAVARCYGMRVANVLHAGDGNLHPHVLFDPDDPGEVARAVAVSHEILRACVELGGSISGEHGIGSEKRELMPLMCSPDDLAAMAEVKRVLDPAGLLNPDKLFPSGRGPQAPKPAPPAPGTWI